MLGKIIFFLFLVAHIHAENTTLNIKTDELTFDEIGSIHPDAQILSFTSEVLGLVSQVEGALTQPSDITLARAVNKYFTNFLSWDCEQGDISLAGEDPFEMQVQMRENKFFSLDKISHIILTKGDREEVLFNNGENVWKKVDLNSVLGEQILSVEGVVLDIKLPKDFAPEKYINTHEKGRIHKNLGSVSIFNRDDKAAVGSGLSDIPLSISTKCAKEVNGSCEDPAYILNVHLEI